MLIHYLRCVLCKITLNLLGKSKAVKLIEYLITNYNQINCYSRHCYDVKILSVIFYSYYGRVLLFSLKKKFFKCQRQTWTAKYNSQNLDLLMNVWGRWQKKERCYVLRLIFTHLHLLLRTFHTFINI